MNQTMNASVGVCDNPVLSTHKNSFILYFIPTVKMLSTVQMSIFRIPKAQQIRIPKDKQKLWTVENI